MYLDKFPPIIIPINEIDTKLNKKPNRLSYKRNLRRKSYQTIHTNYYHRRTTASLMGNLEINIRAGTIKILLLLLPIP